MEQNYYLLLTVPVIYSAGDASAPAVNIGEMYNEGIDFDLRMMTTSDLNLSITGNISTYRNEILALDEFLHQSLDLTEGFLP